MAEMRDYSNDYPPERPPMDLPPPEMDQVEEEKYRESRKRHRESSRESSHRHSRESSRRRSRSRDKHRRRSRSREKRRHRSRSRERSRRHRTPSLSPPPERRRRRRRKPSGWDKPPTGLESEEFVKTETPSPATVLHQTRQARRLYVGNLPEGITENKIMDFFNRKMIEVGATTDPTQPPVAAIQMNLEKNFAFLEFKCNEDATAGIQFDGITLDGNSLKIRRPRDYKPEDPSAEPTPAPVVPGVVSTQVQEGPNKIFVGGLPSYLNEEQVKELLSAFGQLKSFNLVKDSATGNSKGFAFFEYADPDVTDKACQGLNGMKLGEKTILVQRANLGAKTQQQIDPNAKSILINTTACNFLNLGMPIAAAGALLGININDPGLPTPVLLLGNIVSAHDLHDPFDYEDIEQDILNECKKFGEVVSIHIPKPPPPKPKDSIWKTPLTTDHVEKEEIEVNWGVGKVFVQFKTPEEAAHAQEKLSGRKFNGRTCLTGFFSLKRFEERNWEPDPEEEKACADKVRLDRERKEREEREALEREALENPGYYD